MAGIDVGYGCAAADGHLRNLNLLSALDALLLEQNVNRAALALGLSQPSVLAALGRLRHFNDERLHRTATATSSRRSPPRPFPACDAS